MASCSRVSSDDGVPENLLIFGESRGIGRPNEREACGAFSQCGRLPIAMAKVEFEPGIASVYGILMGTDPFYIRRYPDKDGGVMHIVQARPDRSGHVPTEAERQTRIVFAEQFGKQRHLAFLERTMKGQLELPFT